MDDNTKGFLYAFLAVLFFSTFGVISKTLTSTINPLSITIWMIAVSTISLFVYLIYKKKQSLITPEFKKRKWFFIAMGFLGLFLHQITYVKSYEILPASEVVILFYIYPILMIILSRIIFKEKTSLVSNLLILMGFSGLYLAITKGDLLSFNFTLSSLLVIFTAFLWALFSVLLKSKNLDQEVSMFLFNIVGLFFLILIIPFSDFKYALSFKEFILILYIGIFTTAVAFVLWSKAMHETKVSVCSNTVLLSPVMSLIFISIFLKEKIALFQMIGFVIIILSIFININFVRKGNSN